MLRTSGFMDDFMFHVMEPMGQNQRHRRSVQFARWRHRWRSCSVYDYRFVCWLSLL